jgi:hypothetical protein
MASWSDLRCGGTIIAIYSVAAYALFYWAIA